MHSSGFILSQREYHSPFNLLDACETGTASVTSNSTQDAIILLYLYIASSCLCKPMRLNVVYFT